MARSFNGSTDKIATSGAVGISGSAPLTMAMWVKDSQNLFSGSAPLLTYEETGTPATFDKCLYLSGNSGGTGVIGFYVYTGAATLVIGTTIVDDGNWHHLVGYYDGSQIGVYVDGASDATPVAATSTYAFTTPLWNFGNHTSGNIGTRATLAFGGQMAEAGIWKVALSANEIAALAKGARPSTVRPASIVGYYPFWGLQSPEPDLSSKANNGTLTGTSQANHAPVTLFTRKARTPPDIPSGGATFQPAWAVHSNSLIGSGCHV